MTLVGHRLVRHGRFTDLGSTILYSPSRPLLEFHLRRRVLALGNVRAHSGYDFTDVVVAGDRVTGVRVRDQDSGRDRLLSADLVVDATGRGSRMPALLERRGYPRPVEEELKMRLTYRSQLFRMSAKQWPEIVLSVGFQPGRLKGIWLFSNENDTVMLTLGGILGHEPPSEVGRCSMRWLSWLPGMWLRRSVALSRWVNRIVFTFRRAGGVVMTSWVGSRKGLW